MLRKVTWPTFKITCILFLLLSFPLRAFAVNEECYIEANSAGSYTVTIEPNTVTIPLAKYDTPSEIPYVLVYDFPIVLRGTGIGCKAMTPNDLSVHFTNTSDVALQTGYTTGVGDALFKTTVDGITYSAQLLCRGCNNGSDVSLQLLPNGADNVVNGNGDWTWADSDTHWSIRFRLFQTPDFKPKNGVTSGQAIPGKLATWHLGPSGQPTIDFYVSAGSLNFNVSQPTCAGLSVEAKTAYGNQIDLGSSYVSELQGALTPEVPFDLRGDYCGAEKITVKMTAATRSANASLIGKSAGSAEGVGVRIVSTANSNNTLMQPDGSNAIAFDYTDWWGDIRRFPFTAQLVTDGKTIKPGTFTGTATFTFDYE